MIVVLESFTTLGPSFYDPRPKLLLFYYFDCRDILSGKAYKNNKKVKV